MGHLKSFKFIRKAVVFCCFSLFMLIGTSFKKEYLHQLSKEDRGHLEVFLHEVFKCNEHSYTLFGDKPVSITFLSDERAIRRRVKSADQLAYYCERILGYPPRPIAEGFAVWKKLCASYSSKNYTMLIREEKGYPDFAFLINHHAFHKVVTENLKDLQAEYPIANSEMFLKMLQEGTIELFKHDFLSPVDHYALGILLGYGSENTKYFLKMWDVDVEKDDFCDHDTRLFAIDPPNFAIDKNYKGNEALRDKYNRLGMELMEKLSADDWAERILERYFDQTSD